MRLGSAGSAMRLSGVLPYQVVMLSLEMERQNASCGSDRLIQRSMRANKPSLTRRLMAEVNFAAIRCQARNSRTITFATGGQTSTGSVAGPFGNNSAGALLSTTLTKTTPAISENTAPSSVMKVRGGPLFLSGGTAISTT